MDALNQREFLRAVYGPTDGLTKGDQNRIEAVFNTIEQRRLTSTVLNFFLDWFPNGAKIYPVQFPDGVFYGKEGPWDYGTMNFVERLGFGKEPSDVILFSRISLKSDPSAHGFSSIFVLASRLTLGHIHVDENPAWMENCDHLFPRIDEKYFKTSLPFNLSDAG